MVDVAQDSTGNAEQARIRNHDQAWWPDSEVEVDETFVGGHKKNIYADKKVRYEAKGGASGKTVAQGILDRTARQVRATVVPNVKRETLQNTNLLRRRIKTLKLKLSHQSFIKVAKVNLRQLSIQKRIDRPTLALLQQGLRTASLNAKHTSWQTSPSGDQPANIQLISTTELKFKRVRLPPGSGL
jgi:hypothetical protein